MLSVFDRHRETSWPKVEFVRIGDLRRGMGDASIVDVWEGILIIVCKVRKFRSGMDIPREGRKFIIRIVE